ncbi:MAG: hypothetical protein AAF533_19315 [Acidobacteriota bacterium]
MTQIRWALKLLRDVLLLGPINGSYGISLLTLVLLLIGLVIVGAQVSAPFIYTLF